MSQPYLGQISVFGFDFAPQGYALCNGQLLPINQNQALFSLLGTTYGGDGQTTFALPNLQGRCAIHMGNASGGNYNEGQAGGELNHALAANELPAHTHPMAASSGAGTQASPVGNYPGASNTNLYSSGAGTTLGNGSSQTGGGQAHPNQSPFLVVAFCIATQGIFPSRN